MPAARLSFLLGFSAALALGCTSRSEGRAVEDSAAAATQPPVVSMLDGQVCPAPDLIGHGFDDGKWGPFLDGGGRARVVRDSTANGGWAIRKDWKHGSHDSGTVWGRWKPAVQAVHVRFRYKQDSAFDNDGILKLVRVLAPSFGEMLGSLVVQWGRFGFGWDASTEDWQREFTINVGKPVRPDDLRGAWHWYEVWLDISTDRALRMKLWIDGELRMDHTAPFPNRDITYGTVQFTGTFNAPAANGTSWLDDLAVSRRCIGVPQPRATAASSARR
ncbi:MAG: hypothetical protein ACT4PJ_16970 [Gemmatimonadaceae bacterium]